MYIFLVLLLIFTSCTIEAAKPLFQSQTNSANLFYPEDSQGGYDTLTGNIEVAVTSNDLIPQEPTSITGFGSTMKRMIPANFSNVDLGPEFCKAYEGIDLSTRVKVVLFRGDNTEGNKGYYLLVNYDVVAVAADFNIKLLADLAKSFPLLNLTQINTNVFATHTHAGPAGLSQNSFWAMAVCDRYNENLYNLVREQTIATLSQAINQLTPIDAVDEVNTQLEGYNYSRVDNMEVDKSNYFINFKNNGRSLGCINVFGVHSTWFGQDNLKLSADFAGYAEQSLQNATGANTCVFFASTVGNASPYTPPNNNYVAYTNQYAADLLQYETLNNPPPQDLRFGTLFIRLPGFEVNYDGCGVDLNPISETLLDNMLVIRGKDITNNITKIGWFYMGGVYFFMFPGEPLYDVKQTLAALLPLSLPEVETFYFLSLANDHVGYVMMPPTYHTESAESCSTLHGPNAANTIMNSLITGLKQSEQ